MRPQLRSVGVIAFATDSKQVGKAAVGPFRQLTLWTAVDAAATIGSIAGAVAFLITSEAVLAGIPVVLPLVAWYAGRQKEGLQVEVGHSTLLLRIEQSALHLSSTRFLHNTSALPILQNGPCLGVMLCLLQAAIQRAATQWPVQSMTPSSAADNVASALQQLQRDSQQQQIITKHVKSVEAKLNALEGSVVTAGTLGLKLLPIYSTAAAFTTAQKYNQYQALCTLVVLKRMPQRCWYERHVLVKHGLLCSEERSRLTMT